MLLLGCGGALQHRLLPLGYVAHRISHLIHFHVILSWSWNIAFTINLLTYAYSFRCRSLGPIVHRSPYSIVLQYHIKIRVQPTFKVLNTYSLVFLTPSKTGFNIETAISINFLYRLPLSFTSLCSFPNLFPYRLLFTLPTIALLPHGQLLDKPANL